MRLKAKYDTGQGPKVVDIGPWGMVCWERRTKTRLSELTQGPGIDDLAFMVFSELKAAKAVDGTYDAWLLTLLDVEPEAANPPPLLGQEASSDL